MLTHLFLCLLSLTASANQTLQSDDLRLLAAAEHYRCDEDNPCVLALEELTNRLILYSFENDCPAPDGREGGFFVVSLPRASPIRKLAHRLECLAESDEDGIAVLQLDQEHCHLTLATIELNQTLLLLSRHNKADAKRNAYLFRLIDAEGRLRHWRVPRTARD